MYLLCNMRMVIGKVPAAKQMIIPIIAQFVLPELGSSELLLRARANDVYTEYGKEKMDYEVLKQSAEAIFRCLSQDSSALVNIKAAMSFQSLMGHPQAK